MVKRVKIITKGCCIQGWYMREVSYRDIGYHSEDPAMHSNSGEGICKHPLPCAKDLIGWS